MFISDMGAILRPHHGLGVASNAPYRDGAPSVYEGGVRVPAIFRWPGKLPAGTVLAEVLCQLDILPLCLAVAGQPWPAERVLDGIDPLPVLRGEQPAPPRPLVYNYREAFGLREGDWKIVRNQANQPWELYRLDRDPAESRDVAAQYPAQLAQLEASFARWRREVQRDASPVAARPSRRQVAPAGKP